MGLWHSFYLVYKDFQIRFEFKQPGQHVRLSYENCRLNFKINLSANLSFKFGLQFKPALEGLNWVFSRMKRGAFKKEFDK